ncbi:unnamed protein product [Auanema sp. JU1783]|nr:unnamed protein product [Auanema sp. JU1783]
MIRSLCCRANKIDDVDDTVVIKENYVDTIFIYFSSNILGRSLLGRFMTALEEKNLASQSIMFTTINSTKMNSSPLFRNLTLKGNNVGVFTIWKGQDVYKRAEEAITRIGNKHAVNRSDVLFTTSSAQTRKEVSLWMTDYLNDSRDAKKTNGKADDKSDDKTDDKPANDEEAPPVVVVDAGSTQEAIAPLALTDSEIIEETNVNESAVTATPPPIVQSSDDAITAEVEAAKTPTPPPPVPQQ